jgi:release factor glutamine methyltransferase
VVTNPPYVSEAEHNELAAELHHEPAIALVGGPAGTEAIDEIVNGAPAWLEPGGVLVCELAPHQAAHALERAELAGFTTAKVRRDMSGRERVLVASKG